MVNPRNVLEFVICHGQAGPQGGKNKKNRRASMLQSMTGFAGGKGEAEGYTWAWELRSVNSKGLDLRFRVPDWIEGLEPRLRRVQADGRG